MLNAIVWIKTNWDTVLSAYGAIVALCTIICKWTPNTKDDAILSKVVNFLDNFSTCFTKKDAEKLEK